MVAEKGASPCNNTLAAMGSGGVYSTPGDMMRWMQQYLSSDFYHRSQQADRMQTLIYQRTQLTKVVGMDVRAEPMRLVWAGSTWRRRMADRELFKKPAAVEVSSPIWR